MDWPCKACALDIEEYRREIRGLKKERDFIYKTAQQWMDEYQNLKDKYEPVEITTGSQPVKGKE